VSDEISHVAQWEALKFQARNFGLRAWWDQHGFYLEFQGNLVKRCPSLADLRTAISDNVAERRSRGEPI
jgi:hypothetical protein